MTTTLPQASKYPRWEAFKRSFTQSNYITDFWNWFMTLMSKAAEMVLFGTVLYSGYQLLPGVPHVPAAIDAAVFVIQQGALDIGGMGLLKLARRAGLPKDSFPVRLGVALVVLMILNVALASIKHTLPMIPQGVFVGIETPLLIARAVVAVLFGHAIHALREEYAESTITVKEASELEQRVTELSSELARVQEHFQVHLSSELSRIYHSFHVQLSAELSALRETFQQYQEVLAQVPGLQAQLQRLESAIREEVRRVKASLEQQLQAEHSRFAAGEGERREERPALRALPALKDGTHQARTHRSKEVRDVTSPGSTHEKFDARAFVFACLQDHPDLKLAELEQLARACHQDLSQPTASRYRKQFFARRESASVVNTESSAMNVQGAHESSTMKAERSDESAAHDESRAVGE